MKTIRLAIFAIACACLPITLPTGQVAVAGWNASNITTGYSPTQWRHVPEEYRQDIIFPQSIGAEAIPTPDGLKDPPPLPKAEELPEPTPVLPPEGIILPPSLPMVPEGEPLLHDNGLPGLPPLPQPDNNHSSAAPFQPLKFSSGHSLTIFFLASISDAARQDTAPPDAKVFQPDPCPRPENSGLLTVYVPYNAKVTINGHETKSKGSRRLYISSGMTADRYYLYEVRAEIVRDGRVISERKSVVLTPGGHECVSFGFNNGPMPR